MNPTFLPKDQTEHIGTCKVLTLIVCTLEKYHKITRNVLFLPWIGHVSHDLHLSQVSLAMYKKGVYYLGIKIFNKLHKVIKDISS
jgi:hypothetical protein